MKNDEYLVWFGAIAERVSAGSFQDAMILACAKRIEKGEHINISNVICVDFPEVCYDGQKVELTIKSR